MKKKQDKPSEAKEPSAEYKKADDENTIHFFSSFEEQENDNYKWLATLTPVEHLQNATALIKRIFADDLKQHPVIGYNLIID
ncbi:MAG: hypothetical protein ABIT08_05170 [Bacteroidia bacterium]